ncbi:YegS/Rv2252/BmrU family lipid kinase [Clostridium tunisiense]|uniref:YegS/Rv2252/BmrU family lipid kinase n=1 Tax=Clostridium tunisiense TaxID=219748 RepID=UPI0002FBBEEA|nr:YegS/Rv2252/BmrU family lipid kinase [Clostridium tunisiense]
MKRVKFIYNPYSGDNLIVNNLDKVIKIHQEYNHVIEPFRISNSVDIKDAFKDMDDSYKYILIAGGDGTIDSVINKMKESKVDLPVAFLPVGTANDFAKYLGVPSDVVSACKQILESKPKRFDLGKINDKYFVNVASSGIFTDISQKTDPHLKNTMGKLAYYLKGLEEVTNLRKIYMKVKSPTVSFEGKMYTLLVFNGQTAGNIKFTDLSEADDGLLDVVIIKEDVVKSALNNILIMAKKGMVADMDGVLYFKTDRLTVECEDDIATDIDGERGPDFPLTITCERRAIKILGYKEN